MAQVLCDDYLYFVEHVLSVVHFVWTLIFYMYYLLFFKIETGSVFFLHVYVLRDYGCPIYTFF